MQVNILEAKTRLSQLIKAAQAGEEVVIANRGEPVAKIVPAGKEVAVATGSSPRILEWLDSHTVPAYVRRSADEIDAAIKAERESWD